MRRFLLYKKQVEKQKLFGLKTIYYKKRKATKAKLLFEKSKRENFTSFFRENNLEKQRKYNC